MKGLEPLTPGFGDRCSGQLSYTPNPSPRHALPGLPSLGAARCHAARIAAGNTLYSSLRGAIKRKRRPLVVRFRHDAGKPKRTK